MKGGKREGPRMKACWENSWAEKSEEGFSCTATQVCLSVTEIWKNEVVNPTSNFANIEFVKKPEN